MTTKLNIWTQPSGYSFGIFEEQVSLGSDGIQLPVANDSGVSYSVISGSLPGGVNLVGNRLVGSPYMISNNVDYRFCIRATKSGFIIPDRTFSIIVNGATPPVIITSPGALPVGVHRQYYTLDGSYIDFQLEAYDLSPLPGTKLTYFIGSGDGRLPPGLTLTEDGRIYGAIIPSLIVTPNDGTGTYDETYYDSVGYDFNTPPSDGFDSYKYDTVFYDYNASVRQPYTLNANYQFIVTVTDGANYAQRMFRILVIGDDQFRADSTVRDGFAGQFTADSTFLRNPVWLSDSNLGIVRADNYLTIPVAIYDNTNTIFELSTTNNEIYASAIKVAYIDNNLNSVYLTISSDVKPVAGYKFTFYNHIPDATGDVYTVDDVEDLGNSRYRLTINTPLLLNVPDETSFYIGTLSILPQGTTFDVNTGEIYGVVPYQPQITKVYNFTISARRFDPAGEYVASSKTFSVTVLGDVTSKITWVTGADLGSIDASYTSLLNVNATSNIPDAYLLYTLVSGTMPPGLELTLDGEITGSVNETYNPSTGVLGITTFDGGTTTFDVGNTTIDKEYKFIVQANDQFNYSASTREFSLRVNTPNIVDYSNIKTKPYLPLAQRDIWSNFINDANIFTPSSIYRANDPEFGLQTTLSMLVYAGIQREEAAAYVGAIGLNHKRKRFAFGDVKKAVAIDPITENIVYEVVYVQMVDPYEFNNKHLPAHVQFHNYYSDRITADIVGNISIDSTGYEVSDPNVNSYFPNSISNWRLRIKGTKDAQGLNVLNERNYLPLWMRSIQPGNKEQLGFVAAVPLCFCKEGLADDIILNIKHSGFDFKTLDYTVDRYIIDAVTGYTSDKYLVFKNDRITV